MSLDDGHSVPFYDDKMRSSGISLSSAYNNDQTSVMQSKLLLGLFPGTPSSTIELRLSRKLHLDTPLVDSSLLGSSSRKKQKTRPSKVQESLSGSNLSSSNLTHSAFPNPYDAKDHSNQITLAHSHLYPNVSAAGGTKTDILMNTPDLGGRDLSFSPTVVAPSVCVNFQTYPPHRLEHGWNVSLADAQTSYKAWWSQIYRQTYQVHLMSTSSSKQISSATHAHSAKGNTNKSLRVLSNYTDHKVSQSNKTGGTEKIPISNFEKKQQRDQAKLDSLTIPNNMSVSVLFSALKLNIVKDIDWKGAWVTVTRCKDRIPNSVIAGYPVSTWASATVDPYAAVSDLDEYQANGFITWWGKSHFTILYAAHEKTHRSRSRKALSSSDKSISTDVDKSTVVSKLDEKRIIWKYATLPRSGTYFCVFWPTTPHVWRVSSGNEGSMSLLPVNAQLRSQAKLTYLPDFVIPQGKLVTLIEVDASLLQRQDM